MKDEKLREYLGLIDKDEYMEPEEEYSMINNLRNSVWELERLLIVDNFFKDCPCCCGENRILKTEAVKFQKLDGHSYDYPCNYYTTKKSAKIHKEKIDEWEKEVSNFLRTKQCKTQ